MQGRLIRPLMALVVLGAVAGFPISEQQGGPEGEPSGSDRSSDSEGVLSIEVELLCGKSKNFETTKSQMLTAALSADEIKKLGPYQTPQAEAVARCRRKAQNFVHTVANKAVCPVCAIDSKACQPRLEYDYQDLDEAIKLGNYSESGTGQLGVTKVSQECWVEAIEYTIRCGECKESTNPLLDPLTAG